MASDDIVLYHYVYSPFAKRIVWYLTLRGIPYSQCLQPPILPRPDVARLGISYRRIPLLSIGRDMYLDTRLQLIKLEEMCPSLPRLGASAADQKGIERLLSHFIIDGGMFSRAAQLLPPDLPLLKDPKFTKDRADFSGVKLTKEMAMRNRTEALTEMASTFKLLETTLLADGRDWILKTKEPSLADIEAVWVLDWMITMPGALPKDKFSPEIFPQVYAWVKRFQGAVGAAKKKVDKPRTLSGDDAARLITSSSFHDTEVSVDSAETEVAAQGLKKGDLVTVWPTDTGMSHKDTGKLVGIDSREVVIEVTTDDKKTVRVHAPRHGFRVRKNEGAASGAKL